MNCRRNIELLPGLGPACGELPHMDEPYITCVDAEQEFVVIYNPRNEYLPLDHYSIADGKLHHTFKFPRRCKIPPRSEYCIYTCPGAPNFDHGSLMEYHVLWTNHDGSLRRMEVLNNDRCCVKLLNPKGEIISQCEAGMDNPQAAARRKLLERRSHPYYQLCERAQVAMLYLRIVALVGMAAACVGHSAPWFIAFFWIALSFDLMSREVLGKDAALTSIALLGDRITSLVLACSLLFLLSTAQGGAVDPSHTPGIADGDVSTPAIRLGAIAYYTSEEVAADNSTAAEPVAAASAMAWVGMFVPGLSRRTLCVSLLLELAAVCLNPFAMLCPREVHSYGATAAPDAISEIQEDEQEAQEAVRKLTRGAEGVNDTYALIGQLSPLLLAVLGVAADYYPLHCFISYHSRYEPETMDGLLVTQPAPWQYDLWVCAAALGCVAYNIKLVNNASLVGSAVLRALQKR